MKVKTNLISGGTIQDAQDQAELFYKKADDLFTDAGATIGRTAAAASDKLGRIWHCAFTS